MKYLHLLIQAAIIMLIWSKPALAGPAAGFLGAGFFKKMLINMVVSAVTGKLFGKKPTGGFGGSGGAAGRAAQIMVNKQSNNDYIPVVYGHRRLGGTRAYVNTSDGQGGTDGLDGTEGNSVLNMVVSLCEGQMGDLKQVYFNDVLVFDGTVSHKALVNDSNDVDTEDNTFADSFEIEYHDGRDDQTVSDLIQDSVGEDVWTTNHRLQGVCYLAIKIPFDQEKYESGVPNVTAVVDGKIIADVSNLSNTTSGADQNPVDVLYDYLTNTEYGKGLVASDIDLPSFQASRTYCATRYQINGVLDTERSLIENIDEILNACNGQLVFHNGVYKLKIKGNEAAASITFNQDNIIGDVTLSLTDIKSRLNKITINYSNDSAEVKYNDDVIIRDEPAYLALDANRPLEQDIEMPLITDTTLIEEMGDFLMAESRNSMAIELDVAHTLFGLEAGDLVEVQLDDFGWTVGNEKTFRILQTSLTPENTLNIIAQEYTANIHI